MEQIKDYPSLVDAVYSIVQGTSESQEQIEITSIARDFGLSWDSNACVFGIADAMADLVNLGYCKGHEEFDGHYRCISRSPGTPTIQPSERTFSIPERLPVSRKSLEYIHRKTVRHELGITFYYHDFDIAVKDALHELLPGSSNNEAALVELSNSIQYLVDSGLVAGLPFPQNNSLTPGKLLPNETTMHIERREIFPLPVYFKNQNFLEKIIATGKLRLWITLSGAICLKRASA